jgi:uncharacterized damage-inducible protein DinB
MSSRIDEVAAETDEFDLLIEETTLPSGANQFARRFRTINEEMIAFVEQCDADAWRRSCAGEGWSVAVVAHHVASVLPAFIEIVEALASGRASASRISMAEVHASNEQHARDYDNVGKEDVLELLRTQGDRMASLLRGLNDQQLSVVTTAFAGQQWTLSQVVELVVIGHSRMHLASMHDAVNR